MIRIKLKIKAIDVLIYIYEMTNTDYVEWNSCFFINRQLLINMIYKYLRKYAYAYVSVSGSLI